MSIAEEATQLIVATIDDSFSQGYLFYSLASRPLLNTKAVVGALLADGEITIIEPDNKRTAAFEKGRIRVNNTR